MSWNIEVTGADKNDTLAKFNEAVDKDPNREPKEAVKHSAWLLSEHMGEAFVTLARTYGHTNANGERCNVGVFVNC